MIIVVKTQDLHHDLEDFRQRMMSTFSIISNVFERMSGQKCMQ